MRRDRKVQLVTLVVLAGALAVVLFRSGKLEPARALVEPKTDPTPQDAIYAMLDAARAGNVAKYLGYYTGQMEASLRQTIAETTEDGFAKYLRESNAAIKGIALNEPSSLTDREVRVRVEYVYQDRNEVQLMYLERAGKDWKISRVDTAERVKTVIPYGTPVQ